MTEYFANAFVYRTHQAAILSQALATPTLRRLLFPCRIVHDEGPETNWLRLVSVEDFSLDVLPSYSITDHYTACHLKSDNGISARGFIMTEPKTGSPWRQDIGFEFSDTHVQAHIVTLHDLKAFVAELLPVFGVTDAWVIDKEVSTSVETLRYFKGPERHSYAIRIGWMRYFAREIVDYVGRPRFDDLKGCLEVVDMDGGKLIVSQQEPFRRSESSHREREAYILAQLDLERFTRQTITK